MALSSDTLEARVELLGIGGAVSQLHTLASAFGLVGDKADRAAQARFAIGLAAGGAALGLLKVMKDAALAAGEEQQAFDNASNSFRSHGQSFPTEELAAFASQLQDLTGVEDATIGKTIGLLGTFGLSQSEVRTLTPALLDAQRALEAQGVSAEGLAVALGKGLQGGNVGGLRRMGIFVDEAAFKIDRLGAITDAVAKQGEGAAAKFRASLPGAMDAAANSAGDLQEAIGDRLAPTLQFGANVVGSLAKAAKESELVVGVLTGGLVLGAIALGAYAIKMLRLRQAALEAIPQLVGLARAHLQVANAADRSAASQGKAAGASTVAGNSAAAAGAKARGGGLFRGGGLGGFAIGLGAEFAGQAIPDIKDNEGLNSQLAKRVGKNAAHGAGLGSFFGPGGVLVGGLVGGGAGAAEQIYRNLSGATTRDWKKANEEAKAKADPTQAKANELLEKIEKNTAEMSKAVGDKDASKELGRGRVARALADRLGGRR